MLPCCLCQSLGSLASDHNEDRLESLLDHAVIHKSQIDRFAKTNIFKIFADCFPKIASSYTVREIVDSMEASRNSGSNGSTEGNTANVQAKSTKNDQQRQGMVLSKKSEKWSPIHRQRKRYSWRSSKIPTYAQCRKILEASCNESQHRFQCGVCDALVVLRSGRQHDGFDPWNAIAHVLSHHLDIKPFRCRHCDHTTKHRSSMGSHMKVVHQAPDYRSIYFINEIHAHKKEICEMVETCFGKKQGKASKNDTQKEIKITKHEDTTLVADGRNQIAKSDEKRKISYGRTTIGAHCRRTIAPYSTKQHRFECGVCCKFIALRVRSGPNAVVHPPLLLQHAMVHMSIRPFRCRYCTVAMKTQSDISHHLKNVHKLVSSSSIHYINEIAVHEKEICEMITTCFGKKDQLTPRTKKSVKITEENFGSRVVPPAPTSIHAFCQEMIPASYCKQQRRFECGICCKMITLRSGLKPVLNPRCMVNHVIACHMDIKPYQCRHCDFTAKSDSTVSQHVRSAHETGTRCSLHYVDGTQAYRKEICEMITKCFGRKPSALNSKINDSNDPTESMEQSDDSKQAKIELVQSPSPTSPPFTMMSPTEPQPASTSGTVQYCYQCTLCMEVHSTWQSACLHMKSPLHGLNSHMDIVQHIRQIVS